jgi:hypothetical protein
VGITGGEDHGSPLTEKDLKAQRAGERRNRALRDYMGPTAQVMMIMMMMFTLDYNMEKGFIILSTSPT